MKQPIGVFDSGLGGLTSVKELQCILPFEDIVYFGDTGRVPYGSRGKETIISYAKQDIAFLLTKQVKFIMAACGTVSSTVPNAIVKSLGVGYCGVVLPAAKSAACVTHNNKVGILGTEATIASGSYVKALKKINPSLECTVGAAPLFVSLVENGHFLPGDAYVNIAVKEYLDVFKQAGVDTLILGCTHYPLLSDAIAQYMGPNVTLINSGKQAALHVQEQLTIENKLTTSTQKGTINYFVTDAPERFYKLSNLFLGNNEPANVQHVDIEKYSLNI